MKTLVAAVDFSDSTPGVLAMATSLAKAYGASLHLLHVVEPEPTYTAYGFTPDEFPAMHAFQEEAKRRANHKLEEVLAGIDGEVTGVVTRLVEGSPLHALLEYVKDNAVDMVILGSHGHGVVAALLLGSVAEGMVRKAQVPTLIVPAGSGTK